MGAVVAHVLGLADALGTIHVEGDAGQSPVGEARGIRWGEAGVVGLAGVRGLVPDIFTATTALVVVLAWQLHHRIQNID